MSRMIERLVTLLPHPDLADEPDDLAPVDVEVDAVHGAHDAVAGMKRGPQPSHVEQPLARRAESAQQRCRDDVLDRRLFEARAQAVGGTGECLVGFRHAVTG